MKQAAVLFKRFEERCLNSNELSPTLVSSLDLFQRPLKSYFASLSLSFLTCEMDTIIPTIFGSGKIKCVKQQA